jgi:hypothetical protein
VPPHLPEDLAVEVTARLRRTAADVGVDVVWLETPLGAEFSPICQHRADAGLGWITAASESLPAPLDVMSLRNPSPGCPRTRDPPWAAIKVRRHHTRSVLIWRF